jgi:ABC-type dipeptide/oligopeptide/nickel transport system permease component
MLDLMILKFCLTSKLSFFIQVYFIISCVYGFFIRMILKHARGRKIKYSEGIFFIVLWPLTSFIIAFLFIYLFAKSTAIKILNRVTRKENVS